MAKAKASKALTVQTPEVLDPETTEAVSIVRDANATVAKFFAGAVAFFLEARKREKEAQVALDIAKTWKVPVDGADDEKTQKTIQYANTKRKENHEFWTITSAISRLHKWTVSQRDASTDPWAEVAKIGNGLHQQFVIAENQRAEREAREKEALERIRLETEADAAEAASPELSYRETAFVVAVAVNYDPTVAARQAGYKNPETKGAQLLTYTKIREAIEARKAANELRRTAAAVTVAAKPDIRKAAGTKEVERWSAEVTDEAALVAAVIAGKHNIPVDVLQVDRVKLNEYARQLRQELNRWPGARAVSNKGVQ